MFLLTRDDRYFVGRKAMSDSEFSKGKYTMLSERLVAHGKGVLPCVFLASQYLGFALEHCHVSSHKNRRLGGCHVCV